jgi:hypothetical protein
VSVKGHKPTEMGPEMRCIWDHEPWPCGTVKLIAEIRRGIAAEVRPTTPEPRGSWPGAEIQYERWQTRMDVAEEIEDGIPEGLR